MISISYPTIPPIKTLVAVDYYYDNTAVQRQIHAATGAVWIDSLRPIADRSEKPGQNERLKTKKRKEKERQFSCRQELARQDS